MTTYAVPGMEDKSLDSFRRPNVSTIGYGQSTGNSITSFCCAVYSDVFGTSWSKPPGASISTSVPCPPPCINVQSSRWAPRSVFPRSPLCPSHPQDELLSEASLTLERGPGLYLMSLKLIDNISDDVLGNILEGTGSTSSFGRALSCLASAPARTERSWAPASLVTNN